VFLNDGTANKNLLVIAPTSSGKTFIGEMAAIARVIHLQKIIYLVPLRALADEKYRHFKNPYSHCGMKIVISTRDRNEDDHNIILGDYDIAVMAYEKFNYFRLKCPRFLDIVSLVIIDEMQLINDSKWGPLLEGIVNHIDKKNKNIKCKELKDHFKEEEFVYLSGYWQFNFNKAIIDKKIENCLNILKGNRLIRINKNGILSPTGSGILIAARRIKEETFLFFKTWLRYCKNGDISILELLFLLALSPDGKALPIPFSQASRDDYKKGIYQDGNRKKKC
jgi:replicative superfamily II helicase